jgi:DNA end-binding protein Ku
MARPIWTGFISFGLISIPVELISALKEKEVKFRQLNTKTNNPVQQKLVEPTTKTKREVPPQKIEKGVQVGAQPVQHVVVTKQELAAIKPKTQKDLIISQFVSIDAVDPIFYDKPYYLLPKKQGEKAYALMVRAMTETGRAAVSTFCMRGKEYLTLIRPVETILSLQTLRFPNEIQRVHELCYTPVTVDDKELTIAKTLINALSKKFDPTEYHSHHLDQLHDLIAQKISARDVVTGTVPDDRLLNTPGV